jgi:hypothetical protein
MCHRRELAVLSVSAVAVMSMQRAGEAAGTAAHWASGHLAGCGLGRFLLDMFGR